MCDGRNEERYQEWARLVNNKNTKNDLAEEWRRIRRISVGRNEQAYEESCENEWRIRIKIESGEEGWRIRKIWERKNKDEYEEWFEGANEEEQEE